MAEEFSKCAKPGFKKGLQGDWMCTDWVKNGLGVTG